MEPHARYQGSRQLSGQAAVVISEGHIDREDTARNVGVGGSKRAAYCIHQRGRAVVPVDGGRVRIEGANVSERTRDRDQITRPGVPHLG